MIYVHVTENKKVFFCHSCFFILVRLFWCGSMFCQLSFSAVFFYKQTPFRLREGTHQGMLQKHEGATFCSDRFLLLLLFVFDFRVWCPGWIRVSWIESGTKLRKFLLSHRVHRSCKRSPKRSTICCIYCPHDRRLMRTHEGAVFWFTAAWLAVSSDVKEPTGLS